MSIDVVGENRYDDAFVQAAFMTSSVSPNSSFGELWKEIYQQAIPVIIGSGSRFPTCDKNHKAIYRVVWSSDGYFMGKQHRRGDLHVYLCEFHGCYYEHHDYIKASMPLDCYVIRVQR